MNGKIWQNRTFRATVIMEFLERAVWYGLVVGLVIYFTKQTNQGGLGFSVEDAGLIIGIGPLIGYIFPVFSGALADRFGYRKIILIAFLVYLFGMIYMSLADSLFSALLSMILIASGSGMYRPIGTGTISKLTLNNQKRGSLAFSIFYMALNLGVLGGLFISGLSNEYSKKFIFYLEIILLVLIFVVLFFQYKEEPDWIRHNELQNTRWTIIKCFKDARLIIFLAVITGFWTMFHQIFVFLPKYLYDLSEGHKLSGEKIEMIVSVNPLLVSIFVVFIGKLTGKSSILLCIILGVCLVTLGTALIGLSDSYAGIIGALVVITFGEMLTTPKIVQLLGSIAPKGKTAVYQGFYFLSIGIGFFCGSVILGFLYNHSQVDMIWSYLSLSGVMAIILLLIVNRFVFRHALTHNTL